MAKPVESSKARAGSPVSTDRLPISQGRPEEWMGAGGAGCGLRTSAIGDPIEALRYE